MTRPLKSVSHPSHRRPTVGDPWTWDARPQASLTSWDTTLLLQGRQAPADLSGAGADPASLSGPAPLPRPEPHPGMKQRLPGGRPGPDTPIPAWPCPSGHTLRGPFSTGQAG